MKKLLNILFAITLLAQLIPVTAAPDWLKKADRSFANCFGPLNWYQNDITKTAIAADAAYITYLQAAANANSKFNYKGWTADYSSAYADYEAAFDAKSDADTIFEKAIDDYKNGKLKSNAWAYRLAAGSVSVVALCGVAFIADTIFNKESGLRKLTNKLIIKFKKNTTKKATPGIYKTKIPNAKTPKTA